MFKTTVKLTKYIAILATLVAIGGSQLENKGELLGIREKLFTMLNRGIGNQSIDLGIRFEGTEFEAHVVSGIPLVWANGTRVDAVNGKIPISTIPSGFQKSKLIINIIEFNPGQYNHYLEARYSNNRLVALNGDFTVQGSEGETFIEFYYNSQFPVGVKAMAITSNGTLRQYSLGDVGLETALDIHGRHIVDFTLSKLGMLEPHLLIPEEFYQSLEIIPKVDAELTPEVTIEPIPTTLPESEVTLEIEPESTIEVR